MASPVAPPKSTGAGGALFEDKVCAWFLAHMLLDEPPLEPEIGVLERIHLQTRPDGWFFDDVLPCALVSDAEADEHHPSGVGKFVLPHFL